MATFVISVGGSLIAPNGGVDMKFLKAFRRTILVQVKKGNRFLLTTGGGGTARAYISSAKKISGLTRDDLDWLGIHATRLNGHLVRTIFRDVAYPIVVKDPSRRFAHRWTQPVLVAAGWKPGWSTDYIATRLAKRIGAKHVINLSNTDFLYNKDPNKHADATKIVSMTWNEYRQMVGNKWDPGLSVPFDPVASRLAHQSKIQVALLGPDMKNLDRYLSGKSFKGSLIS